MSRQEFFCIVCEELCELDNHEPFCSQACKDNYGGPPDADGEDMCRDYRAEARDALAAAQRLK